eukprot:198444-Prorocentrum_minimum.AAC.2
MSIAPRAQSTGMPRAELLKWRSVAPLATPHPLRRKATMYAALQWKRARLRAVGKSGATKERVAIIFARSSGFGPPEPGGRTSRERGRAERIAIHNLVALLFPTLS